MSNALAPFAFSTLSSIILVFPGCLVGWRLYSRQKSEPVPRNELILNYGIVACLALFFLTEILKAIYFGMEYNAQGSRGSVKMALDIGNEAAHMLLIFSILQRMISLVSLPSQGSDPNAPTDLHVLMGYSIGILRLAMPFVGMLLYAKVSTFGIYQLMVYLLESFILIYVTVVVCNFL
jgi:hypothetical protein